MFAVYPRRFQEVIDEVIDQHLPSNDPQGQLFETE